MPYKKYIIVSNYLLIFIIWNLYKRASPFSLAGYKDALSIKCLSPDRIKWIEEFVRERLGHLLIQYKVAEIDYINFYGMEHIDSIKNFTFSAGDIDSVLGIAQYVRQIVETGDNMKMGKTGIGYFKTRKRVIKVIDWHREHPTKQKKYPLDCKDLIENYKKRLGKKTFETLEKLNCCTSEELEKIATLVSVNDDDEKRVRGIIKCLICQRKSIDTSIGCSLNVVSETSYFWIVSNFTKHLKKVHDIDTHAKNKSIKDKAMLPNKKQKNVVPTPEKEASDNKYSKSPENIPEYENIEIISGEKGLKQFVVEEDSINFPETIEYASEQDVETSIKEQILDQISSMQQDEFAKERTIESVQYQMDEKIFTMDVAKMNKNGNCLFLAAANQLYDVASDKLTVLAQELRQNVVEYIWKNLEKFRFILTGSNTQSLEESNKICKAILDALLKPGKWGGTESLIAISEMHKVNMVIVNEMGPVYFINEFSSEYGTCVLLAYRLCEGTKRKVQNKKNKIDTDVRDHYDSIVKMETAQISQCAKMLADRYLASLAFDKNLTQTLDDTV